MEATIFLVRRIHCDHDAAEIGIKDAILVPITVVLMPGPSSPGFGVLEDHLGMVVVGFVFE